MSTIDEVSRAIGALQASVTHLSTVVAKSTEVTECLRDDVAQLKPVVDAIEKDVAAMQPIVRKVEKFEQRVMAIAAAVSMVITVVLPYFASRIGRMFGA